MSDDKPYGFKLGDDKIPEPEEPPVDDLLLAGKRPPSAYDRLRRRINLLAFVMPLLLAALIVAGYLDIKRRVSQTQSTGSQEVLNLSRDLESRFSSLSIRQAKLEEALSGMTTALKKKTADLKTDLDTLRKSTARIESLKKSIASLSRKHLDEISGLKKDIQKLTAELKSVGGDSKSADRKAEKRVAQLERALKEMKRQLGDLAEAMRLAAVTTMEAKRRSIDIEEALSRVKSELEKELAAKLDRQALSSELKAEQQRYEKKLAQLTARLSQRVLALEKRVALLTTYVTRLRKGAKNPPRSSSQKVLEQDIKE